MVPNTPNPIASSSADEPDLHDGALWGLRVTKDKTLELNCIDVSGSSWIVSIPRIEALRATDFLEGNIIFEINFYKGSDCPPILVKAIFGYTEGEPHDYFRKTMSEIKDRNFILVEITSSYGCNLLALTSAERSSIKFVQV